MDVTALAAAAWLVTSRDGFRSVFLEQPRAVQYASACHGTVQPLYLKPQTRPTEHPHDHITDHHPTGDP